MRENFINDGIFIIAGDIMAKLKRDSKINKDVENCVEAIGKLPYSKEVLYKAARRFNDRIYIAKKTKKKCQKKKK